MRCAVYTRVSTDRHEQKDSLTNQKNLFINYIRDRGWELHDFYIEQESGRFSDRKELQRLIDDLKGKKFDIILVKELSRLSRNGALSYRLKDLTSEYQIDWIALDGSINTLEGNTDNFGLYAWVYENEAKTTSKRIKSTFRTKARNGEYNGSIAPYGYKIVKKKLIIREDNTPTIVKRIFMEYLSGCGHDAIARKFYNEGISTPSMIAGKRNATDVWHGSTIRKILTNPHYIGNLVQGRSEAVSITSHKRIFKNEEDMIIVENTHEAIISKIDFDLVQKMIQSRKVIRPQANVHLFTNLIFCADCGRGMHFKKNSRGYVCGNFNKHGIKKCSHHRTRESELIELLINEFQHFSRLLNENSIFEKLQKKIALDSKSMYKKLPSLQKQLKNIGKQKIRAMDLLLDDTMSKQDYHMYTKTKSEEEKKINHEILTIKESANNREDIVLLEQLKSQVSELMKFNEISSEFLNRFIQKIEIKADGSPKIHYRFSDSSAFHLLSSSNAQHSTCVDCGNISTG
ncbi:recombinase family protein [Psychrobacillus psychrotolerans]|uniref:recombinase family protein n=1 Tax=Psychrobacillus psychrotolerans TaxID=126156 RepID=UPI003B01B3B5